MPWFQVDDQLSVHRKVTQAGNAAMGLWVRGGSWCQQNLTGGFIPENVVKMLGTIRQAQALVAAGLWHEDTDRSGYTFHDWDEHQMSADEIRERRRKRQEAGRKGGRASGRRGEASAKQVLDHLLEQVPEQVLEQVPEQNGTPVPVPVPTRVTSSRRVTEGNARDPRPHCSRHPIENSKAERCLDCRKRREWDEAEESRKRDDELTARRQRREAIDACLACDQNGKVEIGGNHLADCPHDEARHA